MSLTRTVPAVVPSDFQSSLSSPKTSLAAKKTVLPTAVSKLLYDELLPGEMLATRVVPVSSLFQSSRGHRESPRTKKSVLPAAVSSLIVEGLEIGRISRAREVPMLVPSLFHRSLPP